MANLTYETSVEQQTVGQTAVPATHQPAASLMAGSGRVVCHAPAVLQKATNGRLSRAGNSLMQLQRSYGNRHVQRVVAQSQNRTGLPDDLKAGIENLSGISLDDVQVHYNSSKPAQLQAYAYTQGTEIYVAAGQERHLPHEAWHVVQQAQGRVQPTKQMIGEVEVNDDVGLEREADLMGAKAITQKKRQEVTANSRQQPATQLVIQGKFWEMAPDGSYIWHEEDPDESWLPLGRFHKNEDQQGWVFVFSGGQMAMDMTEDLTPEYASSEQYYQAHPEEQTERTLSPNLVKDFRPISLNDCAVGVKVIPVQGGGKSHTNWTEVMSINEDDEDGLVLTPTLNTEVKCLCSHVKILAIDIGDARQMTRYNISNNREGDHTVSWKLFRASLGGFAGGTVENCIIGIFELVDLLNTTSKQTPECLMMCRSMLQGYDRNYLTTLQPVDFWQRYVQSLIQNYVWAYSYSHQATFGQGHGGKSNEGHIQELQEYNGILETRDLSNDELTKVEKFVLGNLDINKHLDLPMRQSILKFFWVSLKRFVPNVVRALEAKGTVDALLKKFGK